MFHRPGARSNRPAHRSITRLAVVATAALALAMPSAASAEGGVLGPGTNPPEVAPAAGGGAAATVADGITTTDLSAVGLSPTALAGALVGPGVTVSNVTYSGASAQAGTIHVADPAVVSFNDGIILSSGDIADVVGPNKSDGITGDMAGPDDADLNALIADTQTVNPVTFDAASLEFDFVPTASQVYFTYTFGSDEYLEWVNLFNDVFAFFVNGQNCATVPNGDPVSIDTINDSVNADHFRDNAYWSPPANPINIESDGLSVEMICSAPVNAGQTNHMKLAIADTSDQILDSVVILKAGSLSITPPESCNDGVDNEDDDDVVDMEDPECLASTTPPPVGSSGVGSDNSAPPFTGNEGTPILLDASALGWEATEHTVSTSWTVDGINGTTGSCTISPAGKLPLNPDGSVQVVTALCPHEGEYVARVDGWDIEGGSDWDTDVDFFVHNAPPAVSIEDPAPGTEVAVGEEIDVSASIGDFGGDPATCELNWGDGATEPGTLADGDCTGTHTYTEAGTRLISVTATDDAGDSSADATIVEVVDATDLPVAHPGAGGVLEGDDGQVTVDVPITLSAPSADPVTLTYQTLDTGSTGIASSTSDYEATSGTVTFAPGETLQHATVTVNGDTTREPPALYGEWILVAFSDPSGATLDTSFFGVGIGIVIDDDPVPTIKPGAGSVVEGNSGDVVVHVPVTLSNPSAQTITVDYTTFDSAQTGVASSSSDYVAQAGTVTFAPGETTKTVSITVHGDTVEEPPLLYGEWILVAFSNPSATATLDVSTFFGVGIGIIADDD
jgi:hypothetical protein